MCSFGFGKGTLILVSSLMPNTSPVPSGRQWYFINSGEPHSPQVPRTNTEGPRFETGDGVIRVGGLVLAVGKSNGVLCYDNGQNLGTVRHSTQ